MRIVLILVTVVIAAGCCVASDMPAVVARDAKVVKLAGGFDFTEGPAVDRFGNIFFTDQPNNKIHKYSIDGELSVWHDDAGRANGLYFDRWGNLITCADLKNELWLISVPDKKVTVLADNYKGKLLNAPNDCWPDLKGGIYFTDPFYRRTYWDRGPSEQDGEHVYYLKGDHKTLIRVADDLVQPNGIIGTPDGKILYVADIRAGKTYAYDIQPDGTLGNKRLFAAEGSDGMTIDDEGNVYLTNRAVSVFDKHGRKLGNIDIPEQPANVCIGGVNGDTLFVTARRSLYAVKLRTKSVEEIVRKVVAEDSPVKKLAGGFTFTEGPAADRMGNIFFSDVRESKIYKYSLEGDLSTFTDNSGGTNGLMFDKEGILTGCRSGAREIAVFLPDKKTVTVTKEYNGKKFNSPNDLWIAPDGGIYFTDPRYGSRGGMEMGEDVYYISAGGGKVVRVIDDMERPNGVIGTADGKTLYVTDHAGGKTYVYEIRADGSLTDKRLFVEYGGDGMSIDRQGNVYLCTNKVMVFSGKGTLVQQIEVPEKPSNVTFGGKDRDMLFITARTSLYAVQTTVKGMTADRGRVKVGDGTFLASNGAPLRGETPRYSQMDKARDDDYWKYLREDFNLNTIRVLCYQEPQNWVYEYGRGCGWDCNLPSAEEMVSFLDTWVEESARHGFYCIIDYHPVGGHGEKESLQWWSVVSPRYRDRTHVLYELCNEPVAWDPSGYISPIILWQEELYTHVRTLAPETHILCFSFANVSEPILGILKKADAINYENASVAFHAYELEEKYIAEILGKYPLINSEIGGNASSEYTQVAKKMEQMEVHSWILLDGTEARKAVEVFWEPDRYFETAY